MCAVWRLPVRSVYGQRGALFSHAWGKQGGLTAGNGHLCNEIARVIALEQPNFQATPWTTAGLPCPQLGRIYFDGPKSWLRTGYGRLTRWHPGLLASGLHWKLCTASFQLVLA